MREYNRFSVWVYVDAPGVYLTFAGFTLYNEGEKLMPAPGRFEGQHFETIYPNKWQRIVWEIPDLYRECVTGFSVHIMLAGAPAGASEKMSLYVTQDSYYLNWAARLTRTVMACQQLERRTDWKTPLRGFFYESQKKKRILAYYHQSQEHLMTEGLSMLLTDAPTHADAPLWQTACEAYADYLRDISHLIAPYEVLPSAVYEVNNTNYSSLYHEGDQVGLPSSGASMQ